MLTALSSHCGSTLLTGASTMVLDPQGLYFELILCPKEPAPWGLLCPAPVSTVHRSPSDQWMKCHPHPWAVLPTQWAGPMFLVSHPFSSWRGLTVCAGSHPAFVRPDPGSNTQLYGLWVPSPPHTLPRTANSSPQWPDKRL